MNRLDSTAGLVHETGAPGKPLAFAPGYANRRINLTWLFGDAAFAKGAFTFRDDPERLGFTYEPNLLGART